jgi:glycosyltransferase involved in cell wall biosynthesis
MNVFAVPSWYPNRLNPIEGIFNREHALAIGAARPGWHVGVSFWGQTETVLRARRPWDWPRVVAWSRERSRAELAANVFEYRNPVLQWSERILHGRRDAIVDACRRNLDSFARDVGSVDVLHAFVSHPGGWAAMRLSEQTGIPYVISEFMGGPFPFPAYLDAQGHLRDFVAEPLARASVRMGVSPTQIARMEELGVRDVELVPLMVDEETFSPGRPEDVAPATFFGVLQLIPDKGIGDLIDAIPLLLQSLPAERRDAVSFRIRGDGDRARWLERAQRLGVERHLVFLDRMTPYELREEYRRCTAFTLPSHHEAGATSVIEALGCGRPVVSTRCGAPEFLVRPEDGLLVDVAAPAQLAEAFRTVLDDPARFDPGEIRRSFLERFSRPVIVDRFEDAYRRATGAGP